MYIVDQIAERVFDVTESQRYNFVMKKNESSRNFRLLIGTEQFIEQNTNGIPIVPLEYSLEQNYPNPFNPSTTIRYTLAHSASVELEIYNILGQRIKTLVKTVQPIGVYSVDWNGENEEGKQSPSGIYYYRIKTSEFTAVKKMTLIK
jgi:hypothetical protein